MSRWSPEPFDAYLSSGLILTGRRGTSVSTSAANQAELASGFVPELLRRALSEAVPRGSRIRITLDASLVRYRIVPWHQDFSTGSARLGFVQHCFAEAFGEISSNWTFRASDTRFGVPSLAAAVDSQLLHTLLLVCEQSDLTAISIQPELMQQFNAQGQPIRLSDYWFVVVDRSNFTLLLVQQDVPLLVSTVERAQGELAAQLERAWQSRGIEAPRCPVFYGQREDLEPFSESPGRWRMTRTTVSPTLRAQQMVLPGLRAS